MKKRKLSEKQQANLFKKGQSGNPEGRPHGSISALTRLKKEFREHPEKFAEYMERYINNPANEKHVMEMLDGKPRQNIGLDGGADGLAINFASSFEKIKQADVIDVPLLDNTIDNESSE